VGDVVATGVDGKQVGVVSPSTATRTSAFIKELAGADVSAMIIPVCRVSRSAKKSCQVLDNVKPLSGIWRRGTTLCRRYPARKRRVHPEQWKTSTANDKRRDDDPMEAHYIGF